MKKHNEILKPRIQFFIDKENEIIGSFQKLNELIENLDAKMKESMNNQERSFLVSFNKVISIIMKDMKTLKDNYLMAQHNFEIDPNIIKFKKEIFFLKNQIGNLNDENRLLRKIMINYKSNAANIQDDRNFEKDFVMETQRENKYLKITLEDLIKENDQKDPQKQKIKEGEIPFKYLETKTVEENILRLENCEIPQDAKIEGLKIILEFARKQHNSELTNYKNENSILKSKICSLTKTNNQIFNKINGISKIEKLFNDSVVAIKEKIFIRKERSKSSCYGQSTSINSLNNSKVSKISEIISGIDVENFNKIDKIELITSFLSNRKFIEMVRDLVNQKKCCANHDCYFNQEIKDINESPLEITKFSEIIQKIKPKQITKTENLTINTERTLLKQSQPKQNYLLLTNRDSKSREENADLSPIENISKEKFIRKSYQKSDKSQSFWDPTVRNSINLTKSDDKLTVYFRKRQFRKKSINLNQKSQDLSTLVKKNYELDISKQDKLETNGKDLSFSKI